MCNPEACRRLYFEFESDDNYDAPTPPPQGPYDSLQSLSRDRTIVSLHEQVMALKDAARIMEYLFYLLIFNNRMHSFSVLTKLRQTDNFISSNCLEFRLPEVEYVKSYFKRKFS